QRRLAAGEKIPPNDESLGDAAGMVLDRERKLDAPLPPVAKQALELVDLLGCRDDQQLADASEHQRRQRVIDQRLVIDWQQLFRLDSVKRIGPFPPPPRQDDPLPSHSFPMCCEPKVVSLVARRSRHLKTLFAGRRRFADWLARAPRVPAIDLSYQ